MAHVRRGWLHYCLGRHADAVAAYAAAIKLEPDSVEARVAQLLPLMAASKWSELIKAAQDTLKRDPQNYLALQRMAYAQYNSQRFPEAEQSYRRLVKLYPGDVEMRAALGWAVLRMGKQPEASELFHAVLELSPKHASASAGLQAAGAARSRTPY
jgi:tetratricopeptide (TPR) repeat protein